jgi:hypothetical protein
LNLDLGIGSAMVNIGCERKQKKKRKAEENRA